jgi:two-component system, OmpR family, sensor histidine kinase ArlS
MPVRSRITLLFSLLAFFILSIVCASVYYFSYELRIETITSRLSNRAVTTARLLSQKEIFDEQLVKRIDSSTTLSLKNKVVKVFDTNNKLIYNYTDQPGDQVTVNENILTKARKNSTYYFVEGNKEIVAYYYNHVPSQIVVVTAGEDTDGKANLKSLLRILLLSFLVGNIIIIVTGYIFSGRLLRPIKRINKDIAEISAQNLTRRLPQGETKDEWQQLTLTINDLLNRLQDSFDLQRRFISNASHELSTPLTSISSQLEVALQRDRSPENYHQVIESTYQDVQHMIKLTQTLLEFAKASGDTGGLEISLVRIDEIILDMPAEISKLEQKYTVMLQFIDLPEDEDKLFVFGNEALLLTAIRNIVLNACKYSNDNKASIYLMTQEDSLVISIHNNGKGIPKEELSSIFDPFYRVDENKTTRGFGLGLSLAHRIIKLHKGNIQVHSEENVETIFTITLPAAHSLNSFNS